MEREASAIEAMATRAGRSLLVPRLRHVGEREGQLLLVTDPLPEDVRRWGGEAPPTSATEEVVGEQRASDLAGSTAWRRVRSRTASLAEVLAREGLAEVFPRYLDAVEARHGDTDVRFGAWHGDWSPWNLGRSGGRVVAWDWEHAGTDVPAGLDLPHFAFQQAFIGRRRPLAEAFGRAAELAAERLPELGVHGAGVSATCAFHVAEVALRYLDAIELGASPNPRFRAQAPAALASLAEGR